MKQLETILNDIKDLEGKKVLIFGQPNTLPSEEDRFLMPRVKNFIEALEEYETDEETANFILQSEYFNNEEPFKYFSAGNSYNWSGNIDHNFNYTVIQYQEEDFIIFKVHRYGDVRANYTVEAVLKMTLDQFYEVLRERTDVYGSIQVDGMTYQLTITATYEGIEVYNPTTEETFTIYEPATKEDIEEGIREAVKEAKE
jgi:hypothetical protein